MYHLFGQKTGTGSSPTPPPKGITQKEEAMNPISFKLENFVDQTSKDIQAEAAETRKEAMRMASALPSIFTLIEPPEVLKVPMEVPVSPQDPFVDPQPDDAAPVVEPVPDSEVKPDARPTPVWPPIMPPVPPPVSPIPDPDPVPEADQNTEQLEGLSKLLEKINTDVMSKVGELEDLVKQRSADIRRAAKMSVDEAIDFARKMKDVMYESEMKNLELQMKHMEMLDTAEEKALSRTLKMKEL